MVVHITPRRLDRVPLLEAAEEDLEPFTGSDLRIGTLDVFPGQGQEVVERAFLDRQGTVHIGLADGEARTTQGQLPMQLTIMEPYRYGLQPLNGLAIEDMGMSVRVDDGHMAI